VVRVQSSKVIDCREEYSVLCELCSICVLTTGFKPDQCAASTSLRTDLHDADYETLLFKGATGKFDNGKNVANGVLPNICFLSKHISSGLSGLRRSKVPNQSLLAVCRHQFLRRSASSGCQ